MMKLGNLCTVRDSKLVWLLCMLVLFSLFKAFEPIEPYLVPYLVHEKSFTNLQVTTKIFPISIYSTLAFTFLVAPACDKFSYWATLLAGTFALWITFAILRFEQGLFQMQIMQVTYGFGVSSTVIFPAYIFSLVAEDEFQKFTSITQASHLGAYFLASELGELLVSKRFPYALLLDITLISVGISCIALYLLPWVWSNNQRKNPFVLNVCSKDQGLWCAVKETWRSNNLQLLSFWGSSASL
eukprot:c24509_g1_i3 orf=437-1159(+)